MYEDLETSLKNRIVFLKSKIRKNSKHIYTDNELKHFIFQKSLILILAIVAVGALSSIIYKLSSNLIVSAITLVSMIGGSTYYGFKSFYEVSIRSKEAKLNVDRLSHELDKALELLNNYKNINYDANKNNNTNTVTNINHVDYLFNAYLNDVEKFISDYEEGSFYVLFPNIDKSNIDYIYITLIKECEKSKTIVDNKKTI